MDSKEKTDHLMALKVSLTFDVLLQFVLNSCPKFGDLMAKYKVLMVRHGESEWTKDNLFCGWYNAQLTDKGVSDAIEVGKIFKNSALKFDIAFTSQLSRAMNTLELILKETEGSDTLVKSSWKLNERHYGDLTGMNKEQAAAKYGLDQVQIWRRSYNIFPPAMDETHIYYNDIVKHVKSMNTLNNVVVPKVETLETTMQRVVPYWMEEIVPEIKNGKQVLIVTHGTCLRSLVKYLDQISDEQIMDVNIPTAIPFFYEFNETMTVLTSMKFLSDEERVKKGMRKAASINNKA